MKVSDAESRYTYWDLQMLSDFDTLKSCYIFAPPEHLSSWAYTVPGHDTRPHTLVVTNTSHNFLYTVLVSVILSTCNKYSHAVNKKTHVVWSLVTKHDVSALLLHTVK